MRADVYSGFLTDKVKVFATKKGVPALVLPKRILQKVRPFMLASAMMCTMGCRSGNSYPQYEKGADKTELREEWQSIYEDVVETYHLTELRDKEPLDGEFIETLMTGRDVPVLTDFNYNHRVENQENFWEIIKNGIKEVNRMQRCSSLSKQEKEDYQKQAVKMLSQISRVKGSKDEVDLSDYNNMKAFLFFEKVLQYKDNYDEVLGKDIGMIDERTEVFGRYYQDYMKLEQNIEKYSGVEKFAKALYANYDRFMISSEDSVQANAISRQILKEWLTKEEIKDKNLWAYSDADEDVFCNGVSSWYKRGKKLEISLRIDASGKIKKGYYSPVGTILIHELQHVMQQEPASEERPADNTNNETSVETYVYRGRNNLSELGPTLYSLALEDKIYKEIHALPAEAVLDYGTIDTGEGKIGLGEVAVWFAKMIDKYPTKSVDELVGKKEVIEQLNRFGNGTSFHHSKAFER